MENLCCGTIRESKGMPDIADQKSAELEAALIEASEQGKYPVLCDQSPCLHRMRHTLQKMKLYEPVEFITTYLSDRLEFIQTDRPVAVHITCSMRKMGLSEAIVNLAKRCSTRVFVPEEIGRSMHETSLRGGTTKQSGMNRLLRCARNDGTIMTKNR